MRLFLCYCLDLVVTHLHVQGHLLLGIKIWWNLQSESCRYHHHHLQIVPMERLVQIFYQRYMF